MAHLNLKSNRITKKISAIIVLYYPSEKVLLRLINSIKNTINLIIIVDNTPNDGKTWQSKEWFVSKNFKAIYKPLGENFGIAKAQNIGISLAIERHNDHVIFFDQDSMASSEMIETLLMEERALLSRGINVGAIGPIFIDEKTGIYSNVIRYGYLFVRRIPMNSKGIEPIKADILISSGELVRLEVIQKVGLMREELFIDGVDIEWALRAGHFGYQHFVIPRATMFHNIGNDFVTVGRRKINLHSAIRYYYSIRNHCNLILDPKMGIRFRLSGLFIIPAYILFFSLNSKSRFKTFLLMLRGCRDGFFGKLGRAFNN